MSIFIRLQSDGRALIGGSLTQFDGAPRARVARVNTNGSLDASFAPGSGFDSTTLDLALEPGGSMVVVGTFLNCDGTSRGGFARLLANGTHDTSFNPGRGSASVIRGLARLADGKWLISGEFTSFNGQPCAKIARLNADGSFDPSYSVGAGPAGNINGMVVQPDGRAVVVGSFFEFGGVSRRRIVRLDSDGSVDLSFDPGAGASGQLSNVLLQPDGRLIITGIFSSYGGLTARSMARVLPDGQPDPGFNVGAGPAGLQGTLWGTALQPDGKLVVTGSFSTFNGVPRGRMVRLNADGSVDLSFNPGGGPDQAPSTVVVEPGGSILISGTFSSVSGRVRHNIARLRPNGTLDLSSFTGVGLDGGATTILPQLDGSFLLAGSFTTCAGGARNRIARVFHDGTLDPSFDPGAGANSVIFASAREPGGDLVIAGEFTQYDGAVRHRIARVKLAWIDWVKYCTAGVSSAGCVPSLAASGSASVSAASGFTLAVQNVDGNRQGLVFYALGGRTSAPITPTSTSFFCVRGPVQRTAVQNSGGATGACNGTLQLDWLDFVANNPGAVGAPFNAGVNVQAQGWYRDPAAPKGITLSDALEFITVP
jgi:uncharacterized delta-60 repeat protein